MKKFLRGTALALPLLGGALLSAASPAQASGFTYWNPELSKDGGMAGVKTTYRDGREIHFLAGDGKLHLVVRDPSWSINPGRRVPARLKVGDDVFEGFAEVKDSTILEIPVGDGVRFAADFTRADDAQLTVFSSHRNINLTGSGDAVRQMCEVAHGWNIDRAGSGGAVRQMCELNRD